VSNQSRDYFINLLHACIEIPPRFRVKKTKPLRQLELRVQLTEGALSDVEVIGKLFFCRLAAPSATLLGMLTAALRI
jgi:hypothetical protein